jgi:hypothetical protein
MPDHLHVMGLCEGNDSIGTVKRELTLNPLQGIRLHLVAGSEATELLADQLCDRRLRQDLGRDRRANQQPIAGGLT